MRRPGRRPVGESVQAAFTRRERAATGEEKYFTPQGRFSGGLRISRWLVTFPSVPQEDSANQSGKIDRKRSAGLIQRPHYERS